jgi:RNA polymerase sigma-70 factor (ECF subfamily)
MNPLGANPEVIVSEDEQLMEQVKARSIEAFGELYGRYCDRAYQVAWWVCYDHHRAEEAVRDTFMSIWHSQMPNQPEGGTVAAWLLAIAHYRARDIVRHHTEDADRRDGEHTLDAYFVSGHNVSGHNQVVNHQDTGRLGTLLNRLPNSQREVITLAFYGKLTYTEIATALQLPAETVKGRMRLGLQKLRGGIEKEVA